MSEIHYKDNISPPFSDIKQALPLFATKKSAITAGSEYGWRTAIRMQGRFEAFWVVGRKMFQGDEIAGVDRDHYRFPMLRWERIDGVERCPVLDVFVVRMSSCDT